MLSSFALFALIALRPSHSSTTSPFACSQFDDDSSYTSSYCGKYDATACTHHCANSSTCEQLCGSGNVSCADGGGAVCAMRKLAHIDATCASLGSVADHEGIPARDAPVARRLRAAAPANAPEGGVGCDDHVYCEYCRGYASCEFLIEHASDYSSVRTSSFGPTALALLGSIDLICANLSAVRGEYSVADDDGIEGTAGFGSVAALASSSPQLPSSGQHGGAAFLGLLMSMGLVAMAIASVWRESGEGQRRAPPAATGRYGGAM